MNKNIKFYNTASRMKEEFKPIREGKVGIYSCGPTVYWNQHIGNMYAFLNWDFLVRTLRYLGYEVTWVMNITDVGHMTSDEDAGEDKMEKGAKREGVSVWEIAKKYEGQFRESLKLLNITTPDVLPRATEHINEQVGLAKKIEDRGYAYKTQTGLVFDTAKFEDYPKFANLKLDDMEAGARVDVDEEKKNPWDFLLWVTNQPNHIMKWSSRWGEGFPGWHLECTAMSTKYLGEEFDIHTGGIEHIGVHHTNEIAQGFGAFGHQTARYWLHNAWLTLKEGKMSKSLGNVYTAEQLKEMGYDPLALRYLALTSHYRKGLVFSLDSLKGADTALKKLRKTVTGWKDGGEIDETYRLEFINKIADDLSMAEVVALMWKLVKDEQITPENKRATIMDFDRVLGLDLNVIVEDKKEEDIPEDVLKLAQARWEAKAAKNWMEADRLRDELKSRGYVVKDNPEGYNVEKL